MKVAVYCASSTRIDGKYRELASDIGRLLGERGHAVVNGAGNMGLMAATADACLDAGGEAIGVIPQFMIDEGWHHTGMTRLEVTRTMAERKSRMAELSDGAIVLPGGIGTLDELTELMCLKQLGLYDHPIVIVNLDGYYDPFLQQMQRTLDERFMRPMYASMWSVASNAEEAVRQVEQTGDTCYADRRKCKF
ncbi:MAG: TIGR00730 family Rossman fold protein [Bacteroidaceae bacterium]|nr:TIGR00730 family Rossman fold protein [Bacteroidaceae bacterium]